MNPDEIRSEELEETEPDVEVDDEPEEEVPALDPPSRSLFLFSAVILHSPLRAHF